MAPAVVIERLTPPWRDDDVAALGALLVDAVESGAAVSFVAPLAQERAESWWRSTLEGAGTQAVFVVARDADGIAGTVQLLPSWAPNQPHRGDIAKLIVHRRARRMGLATALMRFVEDAARALDYRLLTLDTRTGDAAEQLYRQLGWTEVGVIPRYAVNPDGKTPHGATVFYKELQ